MNEKKKTNIVIAICYILAGVGIIGGAAAIANGYTNPIVSGIVYILIGLLFLMAGRQQQKGAR